MKYSVLVALFVSSVSFAGPGSSGGGGAYVCRNPDQSINKSLLADLWEAQNFMFGYPTGKRKLSITKTNESWQDQLEAALIKLEAVDPIFANNVRVELAYLQTHVNDLPLDIGITLPADLDISYFPEGCPAEGMMRYDGVTEHLDIKRGVFSALETQTDIAAAWGHEAIYKVLRERSGQETSGNARHLNACLFSTTSCLRDESLQEVLDSATVVYQCTSPLADYYILLSEPLKVPFDWNKNGWRMYFSRIENETFQSAFYADLGARVCFGPDEKNIDCRIEYSIPNGPLFTFGFTPISDVQHESHFDYLTGRLISSNFRGVWLNGQSKHKYDNGDSDCKKIK